MRQVSLDCKENNARADIRGAAVFFALFTCAACSCEGGAEPLDGRLVVIPSVVDLGRVTIGLAGRSTLALSNAGNNVLKIRSAGPSPNLRGEVRLEGVPAAIVPGETKIAELIFSPRSIGPRQGLISFLTDSELTEEVHASAVGLAVDPGLTATPSAVDFGHVVVGSSATATVTVENGGEMAVTIETITADVGTSFEFDTALGPIRTLQPGERFDFAIRYAPADSNLDEGRIVIGDDTALPTRLSVGVRGRGVLSELEIVPPVIEVFGLFTGEVRRRAIDLRNQGVGPHTIDVLVLENEAASGFRLVETSSAPFVLARGEVRRIELEYAPEDDGEDFDRLRIESTALAEPAFVELYGRAVVDPRPELAVSPLAVSFGVAEVGSRVVHPLMIDNAGNADLHVSSISVEPAGAPYSIAAPSALTLAPLDSHMSAIVFEPAFSGAAPAAEVVIRSDDVDRREVRVPIDGEGVARGVPDLSLLPDPVRFGRVPRGVRAVRSVLIENVGSAPLSISGVAMADGAEGRFSVDAAPSWPLIAAPGERFKLAFAYEDALGADGEHLGVVEVSSDDPDAVVRELVLSARTAGVPIASWSLDVELSWSGAADLDLHFVREGGVFFDRPGDCCWCAGNPDWGFRGDAEDDPFLEADRLLGPSERISAMLLEDGAHLVAVHHFGGSAPATAELTVRSSGMVIGVASRVLEPGQRWEAGSFIWDGATAFFVPSQVPLDVSARNLCY